MNALPLMAEAADWFAARLEAEPGGIRRTMAPLEGLLDGQWSNLLLSGRLFRHAHVETLHIPGRLSVLHVCLFAHLDDAAPIFGFDMIAGPSRVTGIFLDFSAVLAGEQGLVQPRSAQPSLRLSDAVDPALLANFAERRILPDWGDIFSCDVLAVRPVDMAEIERALALARQALDRWLSAPGRPVRACPAAIAAGQARYIAGQRRNEHTRRMLTGLIGDVAARRFIDEVLFPPLPDAVSAVLETAC